MRWTNKGHQFDVFRNEFDRMTNNGEGICIFGTGMVAKEITNLLRGFNFIAYYIDNDKRKQKHLFMEHQVLSLEEHLKSRGRLIVIATNINNEEQIKEQLKMCGLEETRDFVSERYFLINLLSPMLLIYRNKIYVELTQISVTERCSLKCRKCAHACFATKSDSIDLLLEDVKNSVDQFFRFVDKVRYFVLIGGEPLLYQDLHKAITYIGEKYGDRIYRIQITTNGSILPNSELLQSCKDYGACFIISNYSKSLPHLKEKLLKLTALLENENITYELFPEETKWMDYGFDHIDRKADENELINVFDSCKTECHEIRNSKYYFCVMARSVSENLMNGAVGRDDYLDLDFLDERKLEDRTVFTEYVMGYSEKGFLDMCNYCNGSESSKYIIPAAEQL